MHYSVLVVLHEPEADLEKAVTEAIAHYEHVHWDWWQIGGRWTGVLDGYEPATDPQNIMVCTMCAGTGTRPNGEAEFGAAWMKEMNGCNGCKGTGKQAKWPTQWAPHAGDVIPVANLTAAHLEKFYTIVPGGYGWFGKKRWEPWNQGESTQAMPTIEWIRETFATGIAVVVDCHN